MRPIPLIVLALALLSPELAVATAPGEDGAPPVAPILGMNPAALAGLKLSVEQRNKLTEIERDLKRKQWPLMGSLRELRWKQQDALKAAELDVDALRRNYDEMSAFRKQMFDLSLEGRKRVEGVLTREQRAQVSEWTPPQPAHRVAEPPPERKPR
jgi:Spy/CpxP family protein refolding chaperone